MAGYVSAGYVSAGYVSDAGRGLEYGVTAFIDTGAKTFRITVDTTGQNWFSFWLDEWITNAALANVAFPIEANGPNSFTLIDGWEFSDGWDSIRHFRRDGLRYVDSSGTPTASWAAILSSGVPAGFQVRYQQQDGLGTTNALRTGNIDQLIQIYGDATHGNFDYTNWLVIKCQQEGYDQAEAVSATIYGTLEDQLYVFGLTPLPNGIAAGPADPTVTVTPEPTPVLWNGSYFSTTITDTTDTHTGLQIMQAVRAENEFNWSDLIRPNGNKFKTVTGNFYGDLYTTPAGVRVVMSDGVTPHPDFNLFNDDTASNPYIPPVISYATATVLVNTRVQLYNVTTATEIDNVMVAGTTYSYTITTEASVGDTLRLRVAKTGREPDEASAVWAEAGVTFLVSQPEDTIYTTWGIDGSTVTEYSLDGTNLQIDANDVDGNTLKVRLGAYYSYALTTEIGIRQFFGALTALSPAQIRVNDDVVNMSIDNINATTALVFTDIDVRLYKKSGATIIAATSKTIHNDYSGVPDYSVVTVGGVNVITGDIADIPAAVLAAAQTTPIHADMVKTAGTALHGDGTESDKFRSVLIP